MSDSLSPVSRQFFEQTKVKQAVSIFLGAAAMMLLGFTSWAGGIANSNNQVLSTTALQNTNDDHVIAQFTTLAGGYGFACFCFLMAFFLMLFGAVYYSPLICGSPKEKSMLRSPQELDNVATGAGMA